MTNPKDQKKAKRIYTQKDLVAKKQEADKLYEGMVESYNRLLDLKYDSNGIKTLKDVIDNTKKAKDIFDRSLDYLQHVTSAQHKKQNDYIQRDDETDLFKKRYLKQGDIDNFLSHANSQNIAITGLVKNVEKFSEQKFDKDIDIGNFANDISKKTISTQSAKRKFHIPASDIGEDDKIMDPAGKIFQPLSADAIINIAKEMKEFSDENEIKSGIGDAANYVKKIEEKINSHKFGNKFDDIDITSKNISDYASEMIQSQPVTSNSNSELNRSTTSSEIDINASLTDYENAISDVSSVSEKINDIDDIEEFRGYQDIELNEHSLIKDTLESASQNIPQHMSHTSRGGIYDKLIITPDTAIENDPILSIIREEIQDKQFALIKDIIQQHHKDGGLVKGSSQQEFKDYLKSRQDIGDFVQEVLSSNIKLSEDFEAKLNNIESAAHSKIQERFAKNTHKIEWVAMQDLPENTQSDQVIKKHSTIVHPTTGKKVCDLPETIIKAVDEIILNTKGQEIEAKNIRIIDIPRSVNNQSMVLSFTAQDVNGKEMKNMNVMACYDKNGKLTEFNVPPMIKFTSVNDNALAYCERDKQIVFLPITKKKYEEMILEVQKNKGNAIDVSCGMSQNIHKQEKPLDRESELQNSTAKLTEITDRLKSKQEYNNKDNINESSIKNDVTRLTQLKKIKNRIQLHSATENTQRVTSKSAKIKHHGRGI